MTRVVAAFPATGKSYLASRMPGVADSDSSQFSWTYRGPPERHPHWPGNYIDHLNELRRSSLGLVLVSTHAEVRAALVQHGIDFTLVYPMVELREEYRERMEHRGSPPALIAKVIDELWEPALAECRAQRGCYHVELCSGGYLANVPERRLYGVAA